MSKNGGAPLEAHAWLDRAWPFLGDFAQALLADVARRTESAPGVAKAAPRPPAPTFATPPPAAPSQGAKSSALKPKENGAVAVVEPLPKVSAGRVVEVLQDRRKEVPETKQRDITNVDRAIVLAARERVGKNWNREKQLIVAANLGLTGQQVAGILAVATRTAPRE